MKKTVIILLPLLCLSGCFEPEIEPSAEQYVHSFFAEAMKRGIRISRIPIHVKFKDLNGPQGRANHLTNTILIDPSKRGWKNNPEALIFHELGHLVLKRKHLNTRVNGFPRSIMSSLNDPIYNTEEMKHRREYYIDELFNPNTPIPEFMLNK